MLVCVCVCVCVSCSVGVDDCVQCCFHALIMLCNGCGQVRT